MFYSKSSRKTFSSYSIWFVWYKAILLFPYVVSCIIIYTRLLREKYLSSTNIWFDDFFIYHNEYKSNHRSQDVINIETCPKIHNMERFIYNGQCKHIPYRFPKSMVQKVFRHQIKHEWAPEIRKCIKQIFQESTVWILNRIRLTQIGRASCRERV